MTDTVPLATILVVDDNDANRLLAQATLEDEGYTVLLAAGGAEAIALFEEREPDCLLLDVRMPDIDGFTACERIRALPKGNDTPIIFLTALRDVDTFDRAIRVGGDDYLTKPVRPTELIVRVNIALRLRRARTELREHYDLLKQQRDSLLRVQLQKERLTAFIVHDLKNPVNAMDLHAQLLLRDQALSKEGKHSAARIRAEAKHLSRMIVNLLDISKADEGLLSPQYSTVHFVALFAEVVEELELNAIARDVRVHVDASATSLRADGDLLRRVITNLVENAIRHAPAGSTVTIAASATGETVEIRVADRGSGVDANMRERIFDPFVQGEASRAGQGLGLAFCKRAIEAHAGTIWVENHEPGAVFCVRMPQ